LHILGFNAVPWPLRSGITDLRFGICGLRACGCSMGSAFQRLSAGIAAAGMLNAACRRLSEIFNFLSKSEIFNFLSNPEFSIFRQT
jgi:hypothetical protein